MTVKKQVYPHSLSIVAKNSMFVARFGDFSPFRLLSDLWLSELESASFLHCFPACYTSLEKAFTVHRILYTTTLQYEYTDSSCGLI